MYEVYLVETTDPHLKSWRYHRQLPKIIKNRIVFSFCCQVHRLIVVSEIQNISNRSGSSPEGQPGIFKKDRDDEYIRKNIRSDEQKYPKTLGTGSEEVYLYYYRAYRERAEMRRPPVWKTSQKRRFWECKIGETHAQDTEKRTGQQGREAPEKKVIALIMKTDTSQWLENMIQEILKNWGRSVPHAIGTEWYRTNPSEVEDIYLFLQSNGRSWMIMS